MKKLTALLLAALFLFCSCDSKMPYNYNLSKYIELGQTEGIKLPEKPAVTDEEVTEKIGQMLSFLGTEVNLDSGIMKMGDYATFSSTTYLGETEIPELSKNDYMVKIGSFGVTTGFSDNFAGKYIGKAFTFQIDPGEELKEFSPKGEKLTYKVTVSSVTRNVMPDLTDAVIAENTDYKTYDEYFKYVKILLQEEIDEEYALDVDDAIWDVLTETSNIISIPEKEYKLYIETRNKLYADLASKSNMELEDYINGLIEDGVVAYETINDFYTECEEVAKSLVATDLITMAVAEKYNLTLDEAAYESWLENQMTEYSYGTVDEFKADFNDKLLRMVCLKTNVSAFLMTLNS